MHTPTHPHTHTYTYTHTHTHAPSGAVVVHTHTHPHPRTHAHTRTPMHTHTHTHTHTHITGVRRTVKNNRPHAHTRTFRAASRTAGGRAPRCGTTNADSRLGSVSVGTSRRVYSRAWSGACASRSDDESGGRPATRPTGWVA
jgi:hypothetical protein